MSEINKSTFGSEEVTLEQKLTVKKEEIAVIWKREDKKSEEYLSIKVKLDDDTKTKLLKESELNFKAFKNKHKTVGDAKPDFVAFKDTQKKT